MTDNYLTRFRNSTRFDIPDPTRLKDYTFDEVYGGGPTDAEWATWRAEHCQPPVNGPAIPFDTAEMIVEHPGRARRW